MGAHVYNAAVAEAGCVALKALAAKIDVGDKASAAAGMRAATAALRQESATERDLQASVAAHSSV